jgi:uncharacterized protein YaiL (DUF2058 family)
MSSSLQEQLLKAGLVSEDDVAKAEQASERAKAAARRKHDERRGGGRRGNARVAGGKGKGRADGAGGAGQPKHAARPDHPDGADKGGRHDGGKGRPARAQSRKGGGAKPGERQAAAVPVKANVPVDESSMTVGLRSARRRTEDLIKDGKLRSHSPEKREREMKRQSILRIIERARVDRSGAEVVHHFVRGTRIKSVYFTPEQRESFMQGELVVVAFAGRQSVIPATKGDELLAIDSQLLIHRESANSNGAGSADGESSADDGYPPVPDDITW